MRCSSRALRASVIISPSRVERGAADLARATPEGPASRAWSPPPEPSRRSTSPATRRAISSCRPIEEHFERYLREHEGLYEPRDGPLRAVIPKAVEGYLACGRLEGGLTPFGRLSPVQGMGRFETSGSPASAVPAAGPSTCSPSAARPATSAPDVKPSARVATPSSRASAQSSTGTTCSRAFSSRSKR